MMMEVTMMLRSDDNDEYENEGDYSDNYHLYHYHNHHYDIS